MTARVLDCGCHLPADGPRVWCPSCLSANDPNRGRDLGAAFGAALIAQARRVAQRETCMSCRFFDPHLYNNATTGRCRRHPPRVVQTAAENPFESWPTVDRLEWCGEFQPSAVGGLDASAGNAP